MDINDKLLEILVCPEDKSSLTRADEAILKTLNDKISKNQLKKRSGELVSEELEGGLIRADGRYLYPVKHGIPIMLVEEAIEIK